MKRKHLAIIYLLILTLGTISSLYMPKTETASAKNSVVIPDQAIRLRILANSDKEEDQEIKRSIRDKVNQDITGWVGQLTSIKEARKVIVSHLPDIQKRAEEMMKKQGLDQAVKVRFGKADFPTKLYGQYLYPAGDYEAVVITLGDGEGANWWCVLFPPLCFLDFSNGTAVSQSPMKEDQNEPDVKTPVAEEKSNSAGVPDLKESDKHSSQTAASDDKAESESSSVTPLNANYQEENEKHDDVFASSEEQPVVVKSFFAEIFSDIF
ncbi:stage II sporulation protein R [Bacillus sp. MUM 13]|uniref:stage II sporulation protein R n=1 Tax=Bacillus sp. MUM 13 TaxID=1678001 RepID=UPI0008F558E8|nr:stage II sporulation protein R [Bacillus sp. MUM 13]OIK12560.1 stage II sporulation protein R [Bacillus sp. MUM 13]